MKKPLLAVMYYQQAKVEADCFNPEAFNDIWIQAAREEIIVYVEMNEITMAYHRCRVACKRVMSFDTGALTPENMKVLRADFLKLLMTMRAGQCAMQCGNMEDTKKYARRALDILYKLHGEDAKTRRIAHCLYYLGMVAFKHEEDLHKAARYLQDADAACVEAYVVVFEA